MNLSAKQTLTVETYVEIDYEGSLLTESDKADFSPESLPWKYWFQTWLEALYPNIPVADAYELSLRLTSDRQITILNEQYRQKNRPTDVLAFAALEADIPLPPDEDYLSEPLYLGDIVISLDTAARQAQAEVHSLSVELAWLAAHGLLHLLGWDHPDEQSLEKMLAEQTKLLKYVNITR
ncbi:rRNA maturation RNase YbeY [Pleurocapsales cyanobacterium LEGE 06147]|nr:rRNA maturation RNase YbeY [Pleurocapsales cyanobacterium LEGE 06147]